MARRRCGKQRYAGRCVRAALDRLRHGRPSAGCLRHRAGTPEGSATGRSLASVDGYPGGLVERRRKPVSRGRPLGREFPRPETHRTGRRGDRQQPGSRGCRSEGRSGLAVGADRRCADPALGWRRGGGRKHPKPRCRPHPQAQRRRHRRLLGARPLGQAEVRSGVGSGRGFGGRERCSLGSPVDRCDRGAVLDSLYRNRPADRGCQRSGQPVRSARHTRTGPGEQVSPPSSTWFRRRAG